MWSCGSRARTRPRATRTRSVTASSPTALRCWSRPRTSSTSSGAAGRGRSRCAISRSTGRRRSTSGFRRSRQADAGRSMSFALSAKAEALQEEVFGFMEDHVYPAEAVYLEQMEAAPDPGWDPPILEELKAEARRRGLWNLFLPHATEWTEGLSNSDYAPLC